MLQLKKFPNIPFSTQEEHRVSLPQLKKSPGFSLLIPRGGSIFCFVWKGIPVFPSHLKRRRSPLDTPEELQGSCHRLKRPRCPSALQIHLTPLHLTRWSPQGSTQNTMAVVTALWHLKREPLILVSRSKPDAVFPAREESGRACLHMRQGLTPLWKPQRNAEIHVRSGEET